jgi:hypothetical protein
MNSSALLGITFLLAILGAILVIFGAVYTARTSDTAGTYYGYPIWSPPAASYLPVVPPSDTTISANYTLNYVGLAILLTAISIPLASLGSKQNMSTEVSND